MERVDETVGPLVKPGKCYPLILLNKRLFVREEESIPVNDVSPGVYAVAAQLLEYQFLHGSLLAI